MRKILNSFSFVFFALFLCSFSSDFIEDSAECQQYASNAVEETMEQGGYAGMGFFAALDEMEDDYQWYYDYCESNCSVCNSPNVSLD